VIEKNRVQRGMAIERREARLIVTDTPHRSRWSAETPSSPTAPAADLRDDSKTQGEMGSKFCDWDQKTAMATQTAPAAARDANRLAAAYRLADPAAEEAMARSLRQ
jgi:hypothetical protein